MILKLKTGTVEIELYNDIAPKHAERFKKLSDDGKYDGVVFHRVIEGFMAQSGDVKFGNSTNSEYNINLAGTGGSDWPDLKAECYDVPHDRGTVSAARASDQNSANGQFVICLKTGQFLDRRDTAVGKVMTG